MYSEFIERTKYGEKYITESMYHDYIEPAYMNAPDNITKDVLRTFVHDNKQIVEVNHMTYLYEEPHVGAKAIIKVKPGDKLDYGKCIHNKWLRVFYEDKVYWINSQYATICKK